MIEDCHIRAFHEGDLARLHEIRESAFRTVFQSFRDIVGSEIAAVALVNLEQEQADYLDQISKADSGQNLFVAECEGEIVAFCAVKCDAATRLGEIDLNAVHPNYQGRGVGTWMYEYALDQMRKQGMRAATVGTGGDPSHIPARQAYEKAGFGPYIPSVYYYRSL